MFRRARRSLMVFISALLLVSFGSPTAAQLPPHSDFDDGTDQGWQPVLPFNGHLDFPLTGGVPGGCMVSYDDLPAGGGLAVSAPAQFTGDLSQYVGLRWDEYLFWQGADLHTNPVTPRLVGADGTTYIEDPAQWPPDERELWRSRFIRFEPQYWTRVELTGSATFESVLGDVAELQMLVETGRGSSTGESKMDNVALMPLAPVVFAAQPSQQVHERETVSLHMGVTGEPPLSYQWRKDGAEIAGATAEEYAIPSAAFSDAGIYDLVVSNAHGQVVSPSSSLTVVAFPVLGSCALPDNGTGTADFPPACPSGYVGSVVMADPAYPEDAIEILASLGKFSNVVRTPGPDGEGQSWDAELFMEMTGIGALQGYHRYLALPVTGSSGTAPRDLGNPDQAFGIDLELTGSLFDDPDFPYFEISASSQGGTRLHELPGGNWSIDSFFDIAYTIAADGVFSGISVGTSLFSMGTPGHITPDECVVVDTGGGTATFPPACAAGYRGHLTIADGLPPGSTIEIDANLVSFVEIDRMPGGTLGGEIQTSTATLIMDMRGTGDLDEFTELVFMPVSIEFHIGPADEGEPIQRAQALINSLYGEFQGRNFDWLTLFAGEAFTGPSPGLVTLTRLPSGDWSVDSFFDIDYQIDFGGSAGGVLDGLSGNSTDVDRFQAGSPVELRQACTAPDNGSGTIDFPPPCPGGYVGQMMLVDGLPPGTTIEIDARLHDFDVWGRMPGGDLGGEFQEWDGLLTLAMHGTGELWGFARAVSFPVSGMTAIASTTPGAPVQVYVTDLQALSGDFEYDPGTPDSDFVELHIQAGLYQGGLPCPGEVALTRLPDGNWNVDSFFDISYWLSFAGAPGGSLDGYQGITVGTERFQLGDPLDYCLLRDNGTGTIDLPPNCPAGYVGPMQISEGLPAGSTIGIDARLHDFTLMHRAPGGTLGGEVHYFEALLVLNMVGTGDLIGFERELTVGCLGELHSSPPSLGAPTQIVTMDLYALSAWLDYSMGDPDFALLVVGANTEYGAPSPGKANIIELGNEGYIVDSFFDISYSIDFEGAPGGALDGLSGSTLRTDRFEIPAKLYPTAVLEPAAPQVYLLFQNVPNPFNPRTRIDYYLPSSGHVDLQVFDLRGRLVRTLVDRIEDRGAKSVVWEGIDGGGNRVASGVYLYRLRAPEYHRTLKMTLLK